VLARHLLLAAVEEDAVADDVEQAGFVAQRGQRAVKQRTLGGVVARFLPLGEELLRGAGGAVAQSLRVVGGEDELHRTEEAHVEDRLLVGDELTHAIGHLHRAALQLDDHDGDAVEVDDEVGPAFVAALECHFLGQREVVVLRVCPVDQVHRLKRLAGGDLHLDPVAQQAVGAEVRLVARQLRVHLAQHRSDGGLFGEVPHEILVGVAEDVIVVGAVF
jgi:hypothetical protein